MTETADTLELGPCPVCGRNNPPDARFCSGCGFQVLRPDEPKEDGGGAAPAVADPLIGRIISDRYKIESLLGRGGMGVVYKAEHVHIGKLMAVKLLHGEMSRDKDTLKRFRREAEAASKLSHPNSVQIFDFGRSEGLMYLVMEYVEGPDLGQVLQKDGPMSFARAARICAQVCASVGEAHGQGIVHRDLKPENVMIQQSSGQPDFVKVLDFGLAKLREEGKAHITVTRQGHIVGTPYYMSPEQIRGDEVDARGDVYAIGAMLYKCVTGAPPFSAPTPMGVLTKHLTEELEPPSRHARELPAEADAIVSQAMAKEAGDRYADAEELRRELLDWLASVGEDPGPAALSGSSPRVRAPASSATRKAAARLATRGEIERYEKTIKRRGLLFYLLAALVLAGAGVGGWYLWQQRQPVPVASAETEPNNEPSQADRLPPDTEITGYIGQRLNSNRSDADVYLIENDSGERRFISFEVGAVPNMDLVVDLVRKGSSTPVLEVNSGGVGEPERVPSFPLVGETYYLQIRERWLEGSVPTENVSDPYTVRWSFVKPAADEEREVNNSLELADDIDPGGVKRGHIGWAGDLDTFCLTADAPAVVAEVEGVAGLDLVLRVVDRDRAESFKVDERGVAEGERSRPVDGARAGQTCFEVSAGEGGAKA
ncbi:MAG: protein kinase domain-containing protein, partial [Polyangiales bacterium]